MSQKQSKTSINFDISQNDNKKCAEIIKTWLRGSVSNVIGAAFQGIIDAEALLFIEIHTHVISTKYSLFKK